ncbi:MAG: tripartite tricarboxylate transporter TctB family protein [Rhizobiaceae bacterium]
MTPHLYRQNLWVGLGCLTIGVVFAANAWSSLEMGSPENMGPGFLPVAVSLLFAFLGMIIAIKGYREPPVEAPPMALWRPAVAAAAIILFGLMAERFGLVPTVAATALVASLALPRKPYQIVLNVAAVVAFCAIVFNRILGLSLPLF